MNLPKTMKAWSELSPSEVAVGHVRPIPLEWAQKAAATPEASIFEIQLVSQLPSELLVEQLQVEQEDQISGS